jgi:hypothetical protein
MSFAKFESPKIRLGPLNIPSKAVYGFGHELDAGCRFGHQVPAAGGGRFGFEEHGIMMVYYIECATRRSLAI